MRIYYFILGLIISSSASAVATTTMVIDAIQGANGVWTAAGVLDTSGFVRTTGAVTVSSVRSVVPVALEYSAVRAAPIVANAMRLAGPVGWGAAALAWAALEGIGTNNNQWSSSPQPGSAAYTVQSYCGIKPGGAICDYPYSVPCAGGGTGAYGATMNYMGGQYYSGYYCRLQYDAATAVGWAGATPSDSQWEQLSARPIPADAAAAAFTHPSLTSTPVPITGTSTFTPTSIWTSAPYFRDGQWYRDRADISPCPTTSNPKNVCVSVGPVKLDGHTDPNTTPADTDPSYSTSPKTEQDFCAANPNSISCQEMGEAESEPLQNDTVQFNMNPTPWGADNAQCPASPQITLHTGAVVKFDYQPTCDFLAMLRPAIIAFAFMVAIGIAIGRTE